MEHRGRCRICRKHYRADARVGARQVTCSAVACRRVRKCATDRRWRREHPEYFRERRERKPDQRDRRAYGRAYRTAHPEHRARNTGQVRAHRIRLKACRVAVSSASREIRVILRDSKGYVAIEEVRTASGEIRVTLAGSASSTPVLGAPAGAAM
jgi:predicted nucleic acid-binding protein